MPLLRIPIKELIAPNPPIDEIIDVRTPEEFAIDHLPGAINLPVLDDEQRKEVGTIYKRDSPFEARKIGSAYITQNISSHLDAHFATKPKDYRPLIYCWRGGQRSNSLATILDAVGWYVRVIDGGYKAYRKHVLEALDQLPPTFRFFIVGGLTGSGKTRLLHAIREQGGQALDLENLANHKGSLLGDQPNGQPSQKSFENLLYVALTKLDPRQPVFVESESSRIGEIHVPNRLWEILRESPRIELITSLDDRIHITREEYPDFIAKPELLTAKLKHLVHVRGHETVNNWSELAHSGQWNKLIHSLLVDHYDPTYTHAEKTNYKEPITTIHLVDTSAQGFQSTAREFITTASANSPSSV